MGFTSLKPWIIGSIAGLLLILLATDSPAHTVGMRGAKPIKAVRAVSDLGNPQQHLLPQDIPNYTLSLSVDLGEDTELSDDLLARGKKKYYKWFKKWWKKHHGKKKKKKKKKKASPSKTKKKKKK